MTNVFGDLSVLVFTATALQALGLLFQKQIILRLLVLTGSCVYVAYYLAQALPLWDAAIGSALIALANLIGLGMLLYSRLPIGMNEREREVYEALGTLEPGMFRLLMRHGTLHDTNEPVELTAEGRRPEQLHYVFRGSTQLIKGVTSFRIRERVFIGEIGWLMKAPASATAMLPEGGVFVSWDMQRLNAVCARRPAFRQALDLLISRDLACKVATGVQIDDLHLIADPSFEQVGQYAAAS